MKKTNYEDFVDDLESSLRSPRPLNGQIELTYLCNLDCIHCYCKGSEETGNELSTQQWKDILDQIHKEGCLWLTFTGGEPFLRDDFQELYTYARKKGFLINIFSNGVALSFKIFEFLKTNPPFMIEISLYGTSKEVYESITQVDGSFRKIMKNINLLSQLKIPLVLKTVGLKQNKNDILKVKALAEKLLGEKKFKFDSFIFPRLNGDLTPCQSRLSPEEIIEIESHDSAMIAQRRKEYHMTNDSLLRPKEFLYQCNIWRNNFFINPYGRIQFCHLSQKYSYDLNKIGFKKAFYNEFPKLLKEKFKSDSKCISCELRKDCHFCPARACLETGNQEGPVEYYCQLAKTQFKQKNLQKV